MPVLSLQGCMAVGKTTAVRYLQKNAPYVHISYENNDDVIAQIRARKLNKDIFEEYIEIQKLWIAKEQLRYKKAAQFSCSVMDFGAEEIEFYTLNYPKTINAEWDAAKQLKGELLQLQTCMPDRILFLDASEETLRRHKESDKTRSRTFFEHYLRYLLPLKKAWFIGRPNVDILSVDSLSAGQLGEAVKQWVDRCIKDSHY